MQAPETDREDTVVILHSRHLPPTRGLQRHSIRLRRRTQRLPRRALLRVSGTTPLPLRFPSPPQSQSQPPQNETAHTNPIHPPEKPDPLHGRHDPRRQRERARRDRHGPSTVRFPAPLYLPIQRTPQPTNLYSCTDHHVS